MVLYYCCVERCPLLSCQSSIMSLKASMFKKGCFWSLSCSIYVKNIRWHMECLCPEYWTNSMKYYDLFEEKQQYTVYTFIRIQYLGSWFKGYYNLHSTNLVVVDSLTFCPHWLFSRLWSCTHDFNLQHYWKRWLQTICCIDNGHGLFISSISMWEFEESMLVGKD